MPFRRQRRSLAAFTPIPILAVAACSSGTPAEDVHPSSTGEGLTILASAAPPITNQQIPVTFTVDSLICDAPQTPAPSQPGGTWGDNPVLLVTGLHTTGGDGQPWPIAGAATSQASGVRGGDTVPVGMKIFDDGDSRRTLSYGDFAGFHAALMNAKSGDEIGFVDEIISFDTALQMKGSSVRGTLGFTSDSATYSLTYHYDVGTPTTVAPPSNVFGNVSPEPWAGNYSWTVDGSSGQATLHYGAASTAFPNGQLTGTWIESGHTFSIVPRRQLGTFFDFYIVEPGQAPLPSTRHMVGYLMGSGSNLAIAGTSYGTTTTGFTMKRGT